MSEIEDIADTEFDELLQQVELGEFNVVDSRINERLDMLEELLGIVLDLANDVLSTSGMSWEVSRVVCSRLWIWRSLYLTASISYSLI